MDGVATSFLTESVRWDTPFRGEIWEYGAQLDLQKGYAVPGRFDINTARHLIEPFRAIRDPRVRLISIQGANQALKSLTGDITVPYWIEHDPGDILWLFETDPKARRYATERAMPLIRSIPGIYRMLEDVGSMRKRRHESGFHIVH